jgi:hypothetical protein
VHHFPQIHQPLVLHHNGGTLTVNEYSSSGGVSIIFDKFGNRALSGVVRQQPRFVGPDAVRTSTYFNDESGEYYGTTAATAHVAAVAAWMLQLKGGPKFFPFWHAPQSIWMIFLQMVLILALIIIRVVVL